MKLYNIICYYSIIFNVFVILCRILPSLWKIKCHLLMKLCRWSLWHLLLMPARFLPKLARWAFFFFTLFSLFFSYFFCLFPLHSCIQKFQHPWSSNDVLTIFPQYVSFSNCGFKCIEVFYVVRVHSKYNKTRFLDHFAFNWLYIFLASCAWHFLFIFLLLLCIK